MLDEEKYSLVVEPNSFYPAGLSKKNVYDYYATTYPLIRDNYLSTTSNFAYKIITPETSVLRRTDPKTKNILTTPDAETFESLNTGRTVDIYNAYTDRTSLFWLDIDTKTDEAFERSRNYVEELYNLLLDQKPLIGEGFITFSGSKGFHLRMQLHDFLHFDQIKTALLPLIEKWTAGRKDIILGPAVKNVVGLDIATFHKNGLLRTPMTINSATGLLCLPIVPHVSHLAIRTLQKEDCTLYARPDVYDPLPMFGFDPNSTANEGRFRFIDPREFSEASFRRWNAWAGQVAPKGIQFLVGQHKVSGKLKLQTIRFDKSLWSPAAAKWFLIFLIDRPGFERTWSWG